MASSGGMGCWSLCVDATVRKKRGGRRAVVSRTAAYVRTLGFPNSARWDTYVLDSTTEEGNMLSALRSNGLVYGVMSRALKRGQG